MGFFSSDSKVPSGPPPSYPDKDSNPPPEKRPPAQPQYSSGAGPSFQPPRFAALVLARRDRENIAPALGESIARVWVTGIQQQGPYDANSYEWKLSGNPCERLPTIHSCHSSCLPSACAPSCFQTPPTSLRAVKYLPRPFVLSNTSHVPRCPGMSCRTSCCIAP
jgi:hypothetical protein